MSALDRYAAFFAELTPADLARFDQFFTPDAIFSDPFNKVQGVAGVQAVFEHMYTQCAEARFEVLEVISAEQVGYLRWRFHFQLKRDKAMRRPIEGVSRVVIAHDGRVSEHVDYWDAAGELYTQFPVIGGLMRWLRRRLAVPAVGGLG